MSDSGDRMTVIEHRAWVCHWDDPTSGPAVSPVVTQVEKHAEDFRAAGYRVEEYVPAERLRGAVKASAAVVAAWDAYLRDTDEEDDASWCVLRDSIDALRNAGGQ